LELGKRLLAENPELKVVYASGYSAEAASKDFPLEEGVNFLTKPYEAAKLANILRKSLNSPKVQPSPSEPAVLHSGEQ
jgi:DNA-binding NtrC family response regulator